MLVKTEFFENSWDKQLVLYVYDDNDYVVVERVIHHFEGSIEVSEMVDRFQSEEEALEFLQQVHGYDFGFDPKPDYLIDPEWMDNIPF